MAVLTKIDSNVTGLRYAEEASIGVLPAAASQVWRELEPNTYAEWGPTVTLVPRNPINPSRQRKKGVITDLDASGGFNTDLTQENVQDLMQGYFYSTLTKKGEESPTQATATTDLFAVASTTGFFVNDLIFVTGFTNSANNGLHLISAIVPDTSIEVLTSTLVTETPGVGVAKIVSVGHQFAGDDLDVTSVGDFASLTATKDFTELGLEAGEWIFIGGDAALTSFPTNAVNNGFKRVRSIAAGTMVLDKSDSAMITETSGASDTIQVFFASRILRNRLGTSIVRRTYNFERKLGAPNDSNPTEVQAEYIEGMVPSEFVMNVNSADKINIDMTFVGIDVSTIDAATDLLSDNGAATKIDVVEADAFNTSSDFTRIRLSTVSTTDEAPTALFAFVREFTQVINNNLTPNKAVGTRGGFEVTAGQFAVSGTLTAYFSDIAAVSAVQNNSDITLDFSMVKENAGITVDIPLLALGDGRPAVELDQPITLPLSMDAATAAKIDPTLDYTLHYGFYDYLPDAAE
jgi:hypothetical protein